MLNIQRYILIKNRKKWRYQEKSRSGKKCSKDKICQRKYRYEFWNEHFTNKKYCILDKDSKSFLERVYAKYKLNIRTYNNILKIARTIADLSNNEKIDVSCIAEAIQYKIDNKFYKKEV